MKTYPENIRNRHGEVIRSSKNLRGVRSFLSETRSPIKILALDDLEERGAKLSILWENGDNYETNFASFQVLVEFVQRWRNARGAPLMVNGEMKGTVGRKIEV